MSHTYTIHLTVGAKNDAEAMVSARLAYDAVKKTLTVPTPNGYVVDSAFLTDADDWAEHIDLEEGLCKLCGGPAGDRLRLGCGGRVCPTCYDNPPEGRLLKPYTIEDVML